MWVNLPLIKCQVVDCNDFAEFWQDIDGRTFADGDPQRKNKMRVYLCEKHFSQEVKTLSEEAFKEHKLVRYIRGS